MHLWKRQERERAGVGFAVVAGEVKNLANRAADSAKNIEIILGDTRRKITESSAILEKTEITFAGMAESSAKVSALVKESASSAMEQSQEVDNINIAVSEILKVVQRNSTNAEETASVSEKLINMSDDMRKFIDKLTVMVGKKTRELRSKVRVILKNV